MSVYIYSTLSQDTAYTFYKPLRNDRDMLQIDRQILIKGGAGVITKSLITPRGMVTKISDEEYELLKTNKNFEEHVTNGFISIQERKQSITTVVKDMEERDRGSQLIHSDLKKQGMPKVLENRV